MPYNARQRKLFQAAAHNEEIAKKHNMTTKQARELMEEDKKIESSKIKNKKKK